MQFDENNWGVPLRVRLSVTNPHFAMLHSGFFTATLNANCHWLQRMGRYQSLVFINKTVITVQQVSRRIFRGDGL
jgi:hypothetical protein